MAERSEGDKQGQPPTERYSPLRIAEFLLSNATDAEDYNRALEEVRKLGIDPDAIPKRVL